MSTMTLMLPGIGDIADDGAPVLTAGERRALASIDAYMAEHGDAPSVRALAAALEVRPSYAGRLIDALVTKGALRRAPGRARGITLARGV